MFTYENILPSICLNMMYHFLDKTARTTRLMQENLIKLITNQFILTESTIICCYFRIVSYKITIKGPILSNASFGIWVHFTDNQSSTFTIMFLC